jgi:hypothetical protein
VKPVRETISSVPANGKYPMVNGASFSTPVQPIFFSTAQLVGPCSASAATSCVSSTIETSKPSAQRVSQSSWRSCEQRR